MTRLFSLWLAFLLPVVCLNRAAAANYGFPGDVSDLHNALQQQSSYNCPALGHPNRYCSQLRDVTVVRQYAVASWGDPPLATQLLIKRIRGHWRVIAGSHGDAFSQPELVELGLTGEVSAALVRNSVQEPIQGGTCIKTAAQRVDYYFANEPKSGWTISFFGRIFDPYQGTLEPILVDRGFRNFSSVKAGDRVQVCLVQAPVPDHGCKAAIGSVDFGCCNPVVDPRGRFYRMFDYRLGEAYTDGNANHGCGGA